MSEISINDLSLRSLNNDLLASRQRRLREVMRSRGVAALLTADPINIIYGCGVRNMTVFGMMGPSRFLLLFAQGPSILFEFSGSEHLASAQLASAHPTVDEVRPAPGITANSGPGYRKAAKAFAAEIAQACRTHLGHQLGLGAALAVERVELLLADNLRLEGISLLDATEVFLEARRIKQAQEIEVLREAVQRVEHAVACVERALQAGKTEVEVWSAFHQDLIAGGGEYVSTRLLQSGPNTFPYFQEAGERVVCDGDLLCIDTDAIGYGGYAVDLSRTFLCGDQEPTAAQRTLYRRAHEQLNHNAALLQPGRSFEEFAKLAWVVPKEHRPYGYYCLLHGLGLCGEHPYVPIHHEGEPYPMPGTFEPGMVVCIESYIGEPAAAQGVKLEDQFLITSNGAERLTTYPFDQRFLR
jgi:Xaa-Pro aminopeptidase